MSIMTYDVFISYSRKDSAVADQVCAAFDKAGITYFIDRKGIGGGMEFPEVLARAILDCKKVLFIASKNAYESKFTNREITFAFNKKELQSIIPYLIDDFPMPIGLELVFANVNFRTINEHPIDSVLVSDFLRLLGKSAAPAPAPAPAPVAKTYKVGDYYNENGKEGVVFEVDKTGCHGKIVGMKQAELEWCTLEEYDKKKATGATDKIDGMKNMQTIMRIPDWRNKFPAFAWCAEHGEGWYLPAIKELKRFMLDHSIRDAVNHTLSQKGGNLLFNIGRVKAYWSSSENEEKEFSAWDVYMNDCDTYNSDKYGSLYVRAVSAF